MQHKIIFSHHFNEKRENINDDRKNRRPDWFTFQVACYLTLNIQNKINKVEQNDFFTIRIEMGSDYQYFLLKKRLNENIVELIFMSALVLEAKKAFLPYREVKDKNRFDIEGVWNPEKMLIASQGEDVAKFIKTHEQIVVGQDIGYDIKMLITAKNIKKYIDKFDYKFFEQCQHIYADKFKKTMYELYNTIQRLEISLKKKRQQWIKANVEQLKEQVKVFEQIKSNLGGHLDNYYKKRRNNKVNKYAR